MQIETYEIEETLDGKPTPEMEEEALRLIEEMGLEGQQALAKPKEGGGIRMNYPKMTASEHNVYEAVLPVKTKIEEYDAGIIPVRVLQVAAHAKEFCNWIEVWHKKVHDPDPLLVGVQGEGPYSVKARFLLARWGDALKDFSELREEAAVIVRKRFLKELTTKISRAEADRVNVDAFVEDHLNGGHVYFH